MIRVPHHRFNHKGGQLQVGADGMLYAGFGDGGGGGDPDENAQNLSRILGKMIRIDPRADGGYSIPAEQPVPEPLGRPPGGLRLRRAQPVPLLVRPPARAASTIGDVGQDEIEEIDFVAGRSGGTPPRGGYNFGWDVFEGRNRYESGQRAGAHPAGAPAHARRRASARSPAAT